jgi:hypothetical protein
MGIVYTSKFFRDFCSKTSMKSANYTITIKVSGENIQEKTFSPKVAVVT